MAVVTPAVYQAYAERGFGPQLEPHVRPARVPWRFGLVRAVTSAGFVDGLRPEPLRRLAIEGGTGVPLLDGDELQAFVSEADEVKPHEGLRGEWWEFWPTRDGRYAMFPGDDARRPAVATTLWIPGGSARVRRIDLHPFRRRRSQDPSSVAPKPCELVAKERELGAPYVGRCENFSCEAGCTPQLVVRASDGVYRLLGCDC